MMVHLARAAGDPDARPVAYPLVRPDPASLQPAEVAAVAAAVAGNPRWCVIPHADVGGDVMAMVMPAGDNPAVPTWIVHREGVLLRLDVCRWETYTRLGAYPAIAPLLTSLHAAIWAEGG